jgi:hypothetical protein
MTEFSAYDTLEALRFESIEITELIDNVSKKLGTTDPDTAALQHKFTEFSSKWE